MRFPPGPGRCGPGSNHDMSRFATRWAEGDPARARVALLMLLCLRGTPVLYQGDEIGLPDTELPHGRHARPARRPATGRPTPDATPCAPRCPGGTCPVAASPTPGWSRGCRSVTSGACNVEDQRGDPDSMLNLARDLIALARANPTCGRARTGPWRRPPGTWAWRRGRRVMVVGQHVRVNRGRYTGSGTVRMATDRGREGEVVDGTLDSTAGRRSWWRAAVATSEPSAQAVGASGADHARPPAR